jgi:hypothetical protein
MMPSVDRRWRVQARAAVELPLPAPVVWGQMRDLARFLTVDPLHARVLVAPSADPGRGWRGIPLVIEHRLAGFGPDRVGRVLTWHEGIGYSISDLSRRGPRCGFPHVCTYHLQPSAAGCTLTVSARGLWTARFLPRWAVRLWLWWVLGSTTGHIRREMLAFARWRRGRSEPHP